MTKNSFVSEETFKQSRIEIQTKILDNSGTTNINQENQCNLFPKAQPRQPTITKTIEM